MPTDVRKLIFSKQELRVTFQRYCTEKGIGGPQSPLESFQVLEPTTGNAVSEYMQEGLRVILHFTSHDPNNPIRAHIDEGQVLEALIRVCKELHIPLPRRSQKFLQKHKDGLSLTIGMTEEDIRAVAQAS